MTGILARWRVPYAVEEKFERNDRKYDKVSGFLLLDIRELVNNQNKLSPELNRTSSCPKQNTNQTSLVEAQKLSFEDLESKHYTRE